MSDLTDEPDRAGNGMNKSFDGRSSLPNNSLNDATSPTAPRKSNQTSPSTDQPKKKRKVNHACVYCRRSHMTCDSDRPCKRCIKRNIGHLCHDEPREGHGYHKKSKTDSDTAGPDEQSPPRDDFSTAPSLPGPALMDDSTPNLLQDDNIGLRPSTNDTMAVSNSSAPGPNAGINGNTHPHFGYNDPWAGVQNRFHDMQAFHPNYMFNANEVTDEFNLLNDFLSNSLFEETGMYSTEEFQGPFNDPSFMNSMAASSFPTAGVEPLLSHEHVNSAQATAQNNAAQAALISRPPSVKPISDKAREKYYMMAADPTGAEPPEERMQKLLKAKYDAGMLRPFNYVNGYARLNKYMEKNMKPHSRHKILMQLDQFRPKFRERMQSLTDIELVLVEMWFERSLMEYDRIFASMAIPACCWRRTGEIFRGNKEMAELIQVPIESLRDGKLAIHEIIVEDQLVSYWEKFCAICFDQQQKAMLTSCTLRSPAGGTETVDIHCCFSFTIRRDNHNIPSLIHGSHLLSHKVFTRCFLRAIRISQMSPKEQAGTAGSILEFTSHLESVLSNEVNGSAEDFPDLSVYLDALPLPRKALGPTQRTAFDRKGVVLWNTCCKLSGGEKSPQLLVNLAKVRAFSYLLLESSANSKWKSQQRLFQNALRASKTCLDAGLVAIASKVIEQLASKLEDSPKSADHDDLDVERIKASLNAQYLLVRIALAWKQGRLDLAEHFYSQLEANIPQLGAVRVGELLDLCYEIGNDQFDQKNHTLAVKWLKRGCQLADEHGMQIEHEDILDLRLTLIHTCVRALLAIEEPQAAQEAFQLLQVLRQEFGHKLPVTLLLLEVSAKDPSADPHAFSAELWNVVHSAHLIRSNHKLILHYVHHLKTLSISDAIRVLESYIVLRLAPSDEHAWTENAIITLIWLMTAENNNHNGVDTSPSEEAFDKIYRAWNKALSAEATHGALILFWKRIEHTFDQELKEITIKWCQVALHQLFSNAGDNNVGKIERKIVKCQIDLGALEDAYATIEKMSPAIKQHPLSRYLRYSLALRRGDEADTRSTLASLATIHDDRNKLLFAAVSEATQYGSKFQGAQLLQRILDKYKDSLPPEIDASTLLRCTARLLLLALSEADELDEELLSRLCGIFKSGARPKIIWLCEAETGQLQYSHRNNSIAKERH
ncbi:Fungal Zn2-Cys6 binuclear cluster domain-containing protein isoform 3 [Cladophialophora immunda]|nr:Fungal Zn2-Cys6 binuclear cluster domain-containing protein isoform 3 [Cladophialophora immunda]